MTAQLALGKLKTICRGAFRREDGSTEQWPYAYRVIPLGGGLVGGVNRALYCLGCNVAHAEFYRLPHGRWGWCTRRDGVGAAADFNEAVAAARDALGSEGVECECGPVEVVA